ncbi:uncharacterized protein LOC119095987 [Pollicipes pollicipes]|uniref:uncharacterized protein LOC119095826 n=1 Tax=Pollicipes pollicipes TaxID=41117 RepID=UPI0018850B51|nr:uncharacterized protein LOC119095826 [Pollicipes pollicipes]XP_037074749.1 uncharacterized protein LOC119095987 [Pollicipes pollicipes]
MRSAVAVLLLVALASGRPQFGGFSRFPPQQFHRPPSHATGGASSNIVSGVSTGPHQGASITQLSASAGGTASGNAVSSNSASATNLAGSGIFGQQQFSNTNANSNQQTFNGFDFGK